MKWTPGEEEQTLKPAPMMFSCRLVLFILCLLSTFTFMLQRVNVGFALVCMVKRPNVTTASILSLNLSSSMSGDLFIEDSQITVFPEDLNASLPLDDTLISPDEQCKINSIARNFEANSTVPRFPDEGEFEWSREVQGMILGSFYYGYIFTQIFGGWLAERFGARLGLLTSLVALSTLTILNPIASEYGPEFLFSIRLLMGLTHGAALSSINIFSVRWCSPTERAFLMGIAYGGFSIAAAFTFPICGFLCDNFGWRYIFYVTGALGLFVAALAYFTVYDWPEVHPRISERELVYLQKTRSVQYTHKNATKNLRTPWKKLLTSIPINVIHVVHICFVWSFLMLGMYLPTFMKEVLYLDTTKNGLYSSLPYMAMLLVHFTVGSIFDFIRSKEVLTLTNLRKVFNTAGMVGPGIGLILVGFLPCSNPEWGLVVISVCQALAEFGFMGGYMFSIFELAPKYAGVLTGITNTFGVIPGFLCPAFVAYLTPNGSREEWTFVFSLAGGICIFGAVVYLLFGSSELQPWAAPEKKPPATKISQEMIDLQKKLIETNDLAKGGGSGGLLYKQINNNP